MSDLPTLGATRSLAGANAALIAVGAVAGVGMLVSAVGLITLDGDTTTAAVYAGGFGAGLVSLLLVGLAAGMRSGPAERALVEARLARQVEMLADRIQRVAGSLSDESAWRSEELQDEVELAEHAYALALEIGANEHARRLTDGLAEVRARTSLRTEIPKPRPRGGKRFQL